MSSSSQRGRDPRRISGALKRGLIAGAATLALAAAAPYAAAFCGFFVAKADAELFNDASKVVLVRDGNRTVLTMVNDYQGDPSEFAMVVPTPVVLKKEQVHVTENALVDHLDAYTAPRIVEYFDNDPCQPVYRAERAMSAAPTAALSDAAANSARALGVTIEAQYTVGEYDILILSAAESSGLQTWLDQNGYRTPRKARDVLGSYIAQGLKFFVAKVNLDEHSRRGGQFLRPLQLAYETERFMLPIRLGTVNARGKQDLLLFTLTRGGRVETANYRTMNIPSDVEIPLYVQKEFGEFYKATFRTAVERENGRAVFTEYAWDMSWCDPCAADPLSNDQLRELGVFWLPRGSGGGLRPSGGSDVFVTRLHLRYDARTFPEDLRLRQTGDRDNFQGRYITRHPYTGEASCEAGQRYRRELPERFEREARTLANLTGWDIGDIRDRMERTGQTVGSESGAAPWWRDIWKD